MLKVLTCELDLGDWRLLIASPVFGMYFLPIVLEDTALRERCVVETVCMVYVTKPS